MTTAPAIDCKLDALREWLRGFSRVGVAFSGGVDSTLVLAAAIEQLGAGQVAAMIAVSPSLPADEKAAAVSLARQLGCEPACLATAETEDAAYQSNAPNRCFHCKDHVYGALQKHAAGLRVPVVLDGMNAEDTLDVRPGRAAALRHGIRSPLCELGFRKADVRAAARTLGLPNWDKPAAACLASRIPYGTAVTHGLLQRIEAAETFMRSLGFSELRVRHHGEIARIEVPAASFSRVIALQEPLRGGLRALGWSYITLDLDGLRQGSMNEVLSGRSGTNAAPMEE